jgi:hypothetical protein
VNDDIHIRNGELGVEFQLCKAGEIQPTYISRVDVEKTETELPTLGGFSVDAGVVYGLDQIVEDVIEPQQLEPMLAGERLNFSFELVDEVDRSSRLLIRTVFIVNEDAINEFSDGLWLSPSGKLTKTPCA